jgi:hypothetical protein
LRFYRQNNILKNKEQNESMSKKKAITILGEDLTQEDFPNLYQQAEANPDQVEATIKSMVQKQYNNNPKAVGSAMIMLEMDLQHERAANK